MSQQVNPDANSRTSFFDDDDITLVFEFQRPTQKHLKELESPSLVSGVLLRAPVAGGSLQQGFYVLHNRILAYYKNSSANQAPDAVLDLGHSRIQPLPASLVSSNYGFSVTRNGNKFEFFSPDEQTIESWKTTLKGICVLTNFHDEYKALKMIGKGSFAKVYLVESKTNGKTFAVKAFTKESVIASNKNNAKPSMLNEIDIMRVLDHDNVIKLYEVYETEKSIYLVLELIQGKSLQELLKKQAFKDNEPRIMNVISSILEALAYLASKGVMHRDLKPDNILIDKCDKIKIVDFGLATFIDVPEYIFKKCGTPGYIAPEVFKYDQKNPLTHYNDHCDVFSTGCILFYMFFGAAFFDGPNASEILKINRRFTTEFQAINTVKQEVKNPTGKISKDGLDLLMQLLEFEQKNRPAASQALTHTFLSSIVQQKLAGLYDFYQSGNSSPVVYGARGSFAQEHFLSQMKNGSQNTASPALARFTEKDSLYLDVGKPEITGRIDTITSGSTNNSMLLASKAPSNADSSPISASAFSKGASQNRSFKGYGTSANNQQGFLKAAIYRNMQQGGEPGESNSGGGLIRNRLEEVKNDRRHSDFITNRPLDYSNQSSPLKSPGTPAEELLNDPSHENQHVLSNADKIKFTSHTKPSKLADPSVKRTSITSHNQRVPEKDV